LFFSTNIIFFVSLTSSSNPFKFKITSLGVVLSSSLIRESIKLSLTTSKDKMLDIYYWWAIAAFKILSCYLTFNLPINLEINLTRAPYCFSQKGELRIDLINLLIISTSDTNQLIKIPFLIFIFFCNWYCVLLFSISLVKIV